MYRLAIGLSVGLAILAAACLTPGNGRAQRFRPAVLARPLHPFHHPHWGCFGFLQRPPQPGPPAVHRLFRLLSRPAQPGPPAVLRLLRLLSRPLRAELRLLRLLHGADLGPDQRTDAGLPADRADHGTEQSPRADVHTPARADGRPERPRRAREKTEPSGSTTSRGGTRKRAAPPWTPSASSGRGPSPPSRT